MTVVDLETAAWARFARKADSYLPMIERLVGFYMLHDHRNDEDHDPSGRKAEQAVVGLAALTDQEQEGVIACAQWVYYQNDPGHLVRDMAQAWFDAGGPA